MSIFPQAWTQVFAQERGIPFLDGVSLRVRGTRIVGRNVALPRHWCHLVRIGEDFHNRLGVSPGVQNNRPEIRKRLQAGGVVGSTGTKQPSMAALNRAINAGSTSCGVQPT